MSCLPSASYYRYSSYYFFAYHCMQTAQKIGIDTNLKVAKGPQGGYYFNNN